MPEVFEPQTFHDKKHRQFTVIDGVIFIVVLGVIIVLVVTIMNKLSLKHEVSAAQRVTNHLISDVARQDAADAHKLGDPKFQAAHSTKQLAQIFSSVTDISKNPTTIDRSIVSNTKQAQTVYVIYKYSSKTPYFIRVTASKLSNSSTWQLTGISGNNTEAPLIVH